MKPVINQKDAIYYVSDVDIIKFISTNMPMEWNDCCDYVRDNEITPDGGKVCWIKESIIKYPEKYNPEAAKWIKAFFDAHPWMERMMVVFDN